MSKNTSSPSAKPVGPWRDRLQYSIIRGLLGLLELVPYAPRIRLSGWFFGHVAGPIVGYHKRTYRNLDLIFPDMDPVERKRLSQAVPNNFGRTLTEILVPGRFPEIAQNTPIEGEGFEAMKKAREISQPVVLVSGHFGNYDVVRARLIKEGFDVGALYRPPNNPFFAAFYHRTISRVGTPIFRRGRRGLAQMVKFLRGGGTIALLMDQHVRNGAPLTFFGLPAKTALSAADMALKYNALLVPCYGIRQADGLSFKIALEAPIPIGTPEEMTQALNDSLEARVRENMDQWLWIHRRWKDHD